MRLLAIETSTNLCTFAAGDGSRLVQIVHPERRELACRIAAWTTEALSAAGYAPRDVELVAVGRGPGYWTGLRIGLSFARAFAWARAIRCVGIPSADATAHSLATPELRRVVYVATARTGEVAVAEFAMIDAALRKTADERNVPISALASALAARTEPTLVCGEGAEQVRLRIEDRGSRIAMTAELPEDRRSKIEDRNGNESGMHENVSEGSYGQNAQFVIHDPRKELAAGVARPLAHVAFTTHAATAEMVARHAFHLLAVHEASLDEVSPIYASASSAELNFGVVVTT